MKSMALIKCYECGKEISDKAPSCPHCGAPKLVAAKKGSGSKKTPTFAKYIKPIGIGLGIIVIPLAAVASVPLIQANGNIDAVVWRFKNKKFIKDSCYWTKFEKNTPEAKKCQSLMFKLGGKSEKAINSVHKVCIKRAWVKNPKDYDKCIKQRDMFNKNQEARIKRQREQNRPLDQTTYKGKTYTASRKCPVGQNMEWSVTSGFMRKTKVSELGCMTKAQNEDYWREYKLRQAGAPRVTGGGSGSNIMLKQQIHNNRMNILQNKFNQQQLQYQKNYTPSTLGGGGFTTPGGGYGY